MRTRNWRWKNWSDKRTLQRKGEREGVEGGREGSEWSKQSFYMSAESWSCCVNKCLSTVFVLCMSLWGGGGDVGGVSQCLSRSLLVRIWTLLTVRTWKEKRFAYDQMSMCKNWKRAFKNLSAAELGSVTHHLRSRKSFDTWTPQTAPDQIPRCLVSFETNTTFD